MQLIRSFWAAILIVVAIGNGSAQAGTFSSLIVFGDSLNDVGNVYIATSAAGSPFPPAPPYAAGRFSNGPIWVDGFAAALGMPSPNPLLAGGTNFAFGGAESGPGFTALGVPNLQTQVAAFVSGLAGGTADSAALYILWAGSNDYLNGQSNPLVPSGNVAAAVAALAGAGAAQFLVLNLPPLGDVPQSIADPDPTVSPTLNALSVAHNQLLKQQLNALAGALPIVVFQPDIHDLYLDVQADPASFGFSNITSGALLDSNPSAAGYLFWDGLHPTAAGHALIARRALEAIPEPSSLLLAGTGLLLGAWRGLAGRMKTTGVRCDSERATPNA